MEYQITRNKKNKEFLEFKIEPKKNRTWIYVLLGMELMVILTIGIEIGNNYKSIIATIRVPNTHITYNNENFTAIEQDVAVEVGEHFNILPPTPKVAFISNSWYDSYSQPELVGIIRGKITIGIGGANNEIFKYVYTHEYFHQVVYGYGLNNNALNEALTEVYATYTNPIVEHEIFGDKSQLRVHPYDIILKQLNQECLNLVFKDKIEDLDDYIQRLKTYCDVSLLNIINEI